MKKTLTLLGAAFAIVTLMSAGTDAFKEVDLTEKGIPVTVSAPEGAIIEEGVTHGMEFDGVTTYAWEVNAEGFSLEVAMDDEEMWQTKEEYLSDSREFVESDETFDGYELEEENGFICRNNYDGDIDYDFYYIMVKDGKAIEFSAGLGLNEWSFATIRQLYYSAKAAK